MQPGQIKDLAAAYRLDPTVRGQHLFQQMSALSLQQNVQILRQKWGSDATLFVRHSPVEFLGLGAFLIIARR